MVPAFEQNGLLPPYIGKGPSDLDGRYSPFPVSITELVNLFGKTEARKTILDGFLRYRTALRHAGLTGGVQWVVGSFVEQKDSPGDIDVLTIFDIDEECEFKIIDSNSELFDPGTTKNLYQVDAYFVNFQGEMESRLDQLTYYLGLFSHQRGTERRWKGLLQVSLGTEEADAAARSLLEERHRRSDVRPSHMAGEVP